MNAGFFGSGRSRLPMANIKSGSGRGANRKLCLLSIACSALCVLLTACAQQPPTAKQRAEATNRINAVKLGKLRAKGEAGDTESQFNMGVMYARGQGAPQNYGEAAKWFRKAAEHGDARAQARLAVMLANGEGLPV